MKPITIILALLFSTFTLLNAEAPAKPFPVVSEKNMKSCCAKKAKVEKCDTKKCNTKKCDQKRCDKKKNDEKRG